MSPPQAQQRINVRVTCDDAPGEWRVVGEWLNIEGRNWGSVKYRVTQDDILRFQADFSIDTSSDTDCGVDRLVCTAQNGPEAETEISADGRITIFGDQGSFETSIPAKVAARMLADAHAIQNELRANS